MLFLCCVALPGAVLAQGNGDPADWRAFLELPKSKQASIAGEIVAKPPDHALAKGLAALAAESQQPATERAKQRAARRGKRTIEFPHENVLPRRCEYLFGIGTVERLDVLHGAPVPPPPAKGSPPKTRPPAKGGAPVPPAPPPIDTELVHQALLGIVPDADRALASLLRRLDTDTTADAFAVFLHSWRNGDESFYEALDRTAGTEQSLFFFDVMIDDFSGQFVTGTSPLRRGGRQAAHDALHEAFLAYRQYRGFREAVAWSLVLPPDRPLPARLVRYEAKVAGAYSLREQIVMVASVFDHDLDKMLARITATATPLPTPLWQGTYDPYPAWQAAFAELLPVMIERAGSSDAFLARALAERRELAHGVLTTAKELLTAAKHIEPRAH